ncbi:MAG: DUF1122 family protein [Chloroflexi bacterium]|nr:DUF1122 family protein [Chloroflexota bacterium]
MLDSLNNQTIAGYRLRIEPIGRKRFFDQFSFGIYLLDTNNQRSDAPVFRGLYNAGRPSIHVTGWIDGEFVENAVTRDQLSVISDQSPVISKQSALSSEKSAIVTMELAEQLAQKLGALIPAGGILWLAYESYHGEGAITLETRQGLKANLPLLTTPIGFLLFRAECWLGLKNWHFPEGGREGPMKLQGNKALNPEHARERARESIAELEAFAARTGNLPTELERRAQNRAKIILPALRAIAFG